MKVALVFFLITSVYTVMFSSIAPARQEAKKTALEGAREWLALVDEHHHARSWATAAQYFKAVVTKEKWGKL